MWGVLDIDPGARVRTVFEGTRIPKAARREIITLYRPAEVNLLQVNLPDAGYESVGFYYLWDPTVW